MVTISTRVKRLGGLLAIAERFPNVYCSVGTHPHHADEEDGIAPDELIALTKHPKVVALGEAGLDYFYDNGSPRGAGARLSRPHRGRARDRPAAGHPHPRRRRRLRAHPGGGGRPRGRSAPCCIATRADASLRCARSSLGLSISFTGILTFKKSEALRALAAELPADRIMVETDAPYLAPGKFRGKRNEPAYVVEVAKVLAETRGVSLEEISRQTTENFFRLFSKVPAARGRMSVTLTILGCGSSAGVPRPALGWGKCDPNNPKNRRRRCSLLVERRSEKGTTRIVIDTSPDLREQLIDAGVEHIDAVFLTHEHADQTHGIDDLRSVVLHQRRRIPVYFNASTAKDIMTRFGYCSRRRRQRLPANPGSPFDRSRREQDDRRAGRSR